MRRPRVTCSSTPAVTTHSPRYGARGPVASSLLRQICALAITVGACGDVTSTHPTAVACARLSACLELSAVDGSGVTLGGYDVCRYGLQGALYENRVLIEACVREATDCVTVRACIGAGETCVPGPGPGSCEGSVARECFAGVTSSRDCALEGLDCLLGECVELGSCDSRCDGDRAFSCPKLPMTPHNRVQYCAPGRCFEFEYRTGCHETDELCSFLGRRASARATRSFDAGAAASNASSARPARAWPANSAACDARACASRVRRSVLARLRRRRATSARRLYEFRLCRMRHGPGGRSMCSERFRTPSNGLPSCSPRVGGGRLSSATAAASRRPPLRPVRCKERAAEAARDMRRLPL